MKILVLLGSPHPKGTSNILARKFIKGAEEAGHEVTAIDCARLTVHPCIACGKCESHGVCVWTDDMPSVEKEFRACDALVYVTPVYYAGVTAQLKVVMDRFYSFNNVLLEKKPKMALITTAAEEVPSSTEAVVRFYEEMLHYVGAEDAGRVNAYNVPVPESLRGTGYCDQAYQLGKSF
ncbi:MAG: flavodoxin family protein [archaeon]|nr:flavodoxin family protein [archaeon]